MNKKIIFSMLFVWLTLFVALMGLLWPLPASLNWYRPHFLLAMLIFWSLYAPQYVGIFTAYFMGLIVDSAQNTPLGQNALFYALVVYLALKVAGRVKYFLVWQQAFVVMLFVGVYQLLSLWRLGVLGPPSHMYQYWFPLLTTALIWPVLTTILKKQAEMSLQVVYTHEP